VSKLIDIKKSVIEKNLDIVKISIELTIPAKEFWWFENDAKVFKQNVTQRVGMAIFKQGFFNPQYQNLP